MNAWTFRLAYLAGAGFILAFEVIAIATGGSTITENVRDVIFVHPLVWLTTLGATAGFGLWFTRHMWWRKK